MESFQRPPKKTCSLITSKMCIVLWYWLSKNEDGFPVIPASELPEVQGNHGKEAYLRVKNGFHRNTESARSTILS